MFPDVIKPSEFTMHLCFAGMLSNVPLKSIMVGKGFIRVLGRYIVI